MTDPLYISIDIEADGPIPGPFSMLQFGAAAFDLGDENPRTPFSRFTANLTRLPDAEQDPDTMAWWATQGEAYDRTRALAEPPEVVMPRFVRWCLDLGRKLVVVGYPVTYDFMWLYWYTVKFGLSEGALLACPFGFQGLDIKTLAAEKLGHDFHHVSKQRMPKAWFNGAPEHSHDGLTDAIGQGVLFVNMMLDPFLD